MARQEVTGGDIKFISAKALNDAGIKGSILQGTYLGSLPNRFNEGKSDYKFEAINGGGTVIINSAGNLGYLMSNVQPGELVEVEYQGMVPMSSGKFKGTAAHNFKVFIESDEEASA